MRYVKFARAGDRRALRRVVARGRIAPMRGTEDCSRKKPMNRRILVVNHDANSLELISFVLAPPSFSRQGHEPFDVVGATSGEEAIAAVKASLTEHLPFAGAFVEMGLNPGLTGPETLIRLRNLDAELILVALTPGHAAASVGWDLLAKPFAETELLQKANQIVTRWEIQRRDRTPSQRRAK